MGLLKENLAKSWVGTNYRESSFQMEFKINLEVRPTDEQNYKVKIKVSENWKWTSVSTIAATRPAPVLRSNSPPNQVSVFSQMRY